MISNIKYHHAIIKNALLATGYLMVTILTGCKKLVEIPGPSNSITTPEAFNTVQKATYAVTGIYSDMSYASGFVRYANGLTSVDAGLAADELVFFGGISPFQINSLLPNDNDIQFGLWRPAYYNIYSANAAIEGIQASSNLTPGQKDQLTGECKFIRAFCYFYLVNWFGDVPLVTTSDFASNAVMKRTPADEVYQQIIADLKDAQHLLLSDFSISGGERTRPNKWAAAALLARAYLFTGAYDSAAAQSTMVIDQSSLFSLAALDGAFLKNNSEAIFQLQPVNANLSAVSEASQFLPLYRVSDYPPDVVDANWQLFVPAYPLSSQLLAAFEPGDQRLSVWADSTGFLNGENYYFPNKYKVRQGTPDNIAEYYTLLRLGEQYLIRAEARIMKNDQDIEGAKADLNMLRSRAGLPATGANDQATLMPAILHERQVELFAEWGHRWLDLKRTKQADAILGPVKGADWNTTDQLWPIPRQEIINDPNLTQNPGY